MRWLDGFSFSTNMGLMENQPFKLTFINALAQQQPIFEPH